MVTKLEAIRMGDSIRCQCQWACFVYFAKLLEAALMRYTVPLLFHYTL